jgi:hypothetical protein
METSIAAARRACSRRVRAGTPAKASETGAPLAMSRPSSIASVSIPPFADTTSERSNDFCSSTLAGSSASSETRRQN